MQDDALNRDRAHPFLAQHLYECDACLDARLDDALQHPAEVTVPQGFSRRVLASLPAEPPPSSNPWDLWPAGAACLPALAGAALWWNGSLGLLTNPALLVAVGTLEMTFAVLWALRPDESAL